ncbi:hypothetical protein TESG_02761 [Trichophyton tonsurans CBS 112818]|uniref:Uncharacterized protein n=1 Tax=Trichophyton tonsurans (strain CBS 112818) TaxID=647933 RepID=F2RVC2_TRIT1|nr:hypothetical protein TESG_02761 [Trichophyton tonsurans CBS 112818]
MAGQSEREHNAGSEGDQIETGHLSQELKNLIDARHEWLISTKDFERANPLENKDVLYHPEFRELIRKLAHENMAQILLFRTEDQIPKRIYGNPPNHTSYLYPLRIPSQSNAHSAYPGTPGSTTKELRLGMFVVYQDQVFIKGPLDFLLISCQQAVNTMRVEKEEGKGC